MRRAVIAGCGSICRDQWIEPIQHREDVKIAGLVDTNIANAERVKNDFNLNDAATGTVLLDVIRKTDADVVCDCTIPSAHKSVVMTSLKEGCDVLGEKPLAENMNDAKDMISLAEETGRTYAVIQNRRYSKGIVNFKETLQSGVIGKLTTLNSDFYIGAHFDGFRTQMDHVLLLDMAIHCFDQARFIGELEPVSVYCHDWNPGNSWYKHGSSAIAIFEMSNDVVFSYRGSWCSEGFDTSWDCSWKAIGEVGALTWDGEESISGEIPEQNTDFIRPKKPLPIPERNQLKHTGHSGVIMEFFDCLNSGTKPATICTDNIKSLAMVLAAIESAETGRKISIEY
jgi:predicted dehydrogenase